MKSKYTKAERHEIYKLARMLYCDKISKYNCIFLCNFFEFNMDIKDIEIELPEIYLFRFKNKGAWLSDSPCTSENDDILLRETVLELCIEMTRP